MSEQRPEQSSERRIGRKGGRRHRRRWSAGRRLRALLALGVVVVVGTTGTWALWTDQATLAGVTLTSGRIDLKINGQDSVSGYTGLNATNLVPGNSVAAVLTVSNAGTVGLTYTASSTVTNADGKGLGPALQVKVTTATTVTGTGLTATCSGTTIASSTVLGGTLITTSRSLAAGAQELLCVQLLLPSDAATGLQGASTTATLTFTGTT